LAVAAVVHVPLLRLRIVRVPAHLGSASTRLAGVSMGCRSVTEGFASASFPGDEGAWQAERDSSPKRRVEYVWIFGIGVHASRRWM
jgi:hypothetical protein